MDNNSPYQKEFDNIKVVIFMETKPLSDDFEQIELTREHYKKVTKAIEDGLPHESPESFTVTTNDDHKYTFPNIKSFN